MPRVRRRGHTRRGLTSADELFLSTGDAFWPNEMAIQSEADLENAWWMLREKLMEEAQAGTRPFGWWRLEAPDVPRRNESDADALIRLGLLTPRERHLYAREGPTGPKDGGLRHFSDVRLLHYREGWETRRAWHEAEGRAEMAELFAERIAEVDTELRRRERENDPGPANEAFACSGSALAKEPGNGWLERDKEKKTCM